MSHAPHNLPEHNRSMKGVLQESGVCPFYRSAAQTCDVNGRTPTLQRRRLCRCDEHDSCPVYLGFLLRHSRPQRVDCDWLDTL